MLYSIRWGVYTTTRYLIRLVSGEGARDWYTGSEAHTPANTAHGTELRRWPSDEHVAKKSSEVLLTSSRRS